MGRRDEKLEKQYERDMAEIIWETADLVDRLEKLAGREDDEDDST